MKEFDVLGWLEFEFPKLIRTILFIHCGYINNRKNGDNCYEAVGRLYESNNPEDTGEDHIGKLYINVYDHPKNVGILINEKNGSTTEQFLLAAKQSKKVKLFGVTTAGILDISNMYFVNSPDNEFKLGYSLSKSMRIPEMTIDNKGIQPDYYIDKSIPKYKWIEFVSNVLNE